MTAQRKALYGKRNGRPRGLGDKGRFEVYDQDGRLLGDFATILSARRFIDEGTQLQPRDKENKPVGQPLNPGVRVEREGEEVYVHPDFAKTRGKAKGG